MSQVKELTETERVQAQTVEEWLEEYETGEKVYPAAFLAYPDNTSVSTRPNVFKISSQKIPSKPVLIYDSHRTSKNPSYKIGTLTLVFINVKTSQEVVAFFNVDTTHQRGKHKGRNKLLGEGCEFYPKRRCNFRHFWKEVVGGEPKRWAAVHKELKSKFKGLKFTGDLTVAYDKDGKPFNKVTNVRLIEPTVNKIETKVEQDWNKKGTESWNNESPIPF